MVFFSFPSCSTSHLTTSSLFKAEGEGGDESTMMAKGMSKTEFVLKAKYDPDFASCWGMFNYFSSIAVHPILSVGYIFYLFLPVPFSSSFLFLFLFLLLFSISFRFLIVDIDPSLLSLSSLSPPISPPLLSSLSRSLQLGWFDIRCKIRTASKRKGRQSFKSNSSTNDRKRCSLVRCSFWFLGVL
jgi:hypothetical protein